MKKKFLFITSIIITALIITGGYIVLDISPKAEPLIIPEKEKIISVSIDLNSENKTLLSKDDYADILSAFSTAEPTRRASVQDYPSVSKYYTLNFETSEINFTYFIYEEANSFFLESPYMGIYELNAETFELISEYCKK